MNKHLTEIVFILDRSGSMCGLETDTIGGYNAMLKKQQAAEGEALMTTVLFDDKYELLHDRIYLQAISPITETQYYVRGSTALLDAIGRSIHKIATAHKHTAAEYRPGNVMFIITTDGMENASREYSYDQVRKLVEQHKTRDGWDFIFLGANIDAVEMAGQFGITADKTANYHADAIGTQLNYEVFSEAVMQFRAGAPLAANWKKKIDCDYMRRSRQ